MYKLMRLAYPFSALKPNIGAETVEVHYEGHQQTYLNNLNKLLEEIGFSKDYSLEQLIENIDEIPIEVRGDVLFNAGGVINHNLYWQSMSPLNNNEPVGLLKEAITEKYGSFSNFKKEFIRQASLLQGSGYTFLVLNNEKELEIINTPNQESPYSYGLIPLMALDLWEHAYYLDYLNKRSDYINNFFNIVDFVNVNKVYEEKISNQ